MKPSEANSRNIDVLIMMGSDSDLEVMRDCITILEDFSVPYEVVVASAHRSPHRVISIIQKTRDQGVKVIIAAAGGAAHLAGIAAAFTVVPVIGVPCGNSPLAGVDALYSTVQMPSGVPVACVGVNASKNAGLLAVQILALLDARLYRALTDYKAGLAFEVEEKNKRMLRVLNPDTKQIKTGATEEMWHGTGLSKKEFESIVNILGRMPNKTELGMFAAMWSEHCSYKSSKEILRMLPTSGEKVIQGPGENAGVIDIGHGLAAVFKIESHNHPSAVEPFQGAATGVGGIVRDVLAMGAEPIALLGVLRVGPFSHKRSKWILKRATEGMMWYGSTLGIPIAGGDIATHESFKENPLVNAMCVGIVKQSSLKKSAARGPGNPVMAVGARTGRDGIQGAALASAEITPEARAEGRALQIGDSKLGYALKKACLELYDVLGKDLIGIQDMGAAGLTCSSAEMASQGDVGMKIDVSKVAKREQDMTPYEVMLSESQERMLVVTEPGREADVKKVFRKWGLEAETIGEVTDDGILHVVDGTANVARLPAKALTDLAPCYMRESRKPYSLQVMCGPDLSNVPEPDDYPKALKLTLSSPKISYRGWLSKNVSDKGNTKGMNFIVTGTGVQIIPVPGTHKGLGVTCEVNSLYCQLDPWKGAAHAVVAAARNLVASGVIPLGLTDCLNFGNPENPEVFWQFKAAVEGMSHACRELSIPVTGGNVSFYNESGDIPVYPTPAVGMVGIVDNPENITSSGFKQEGDIIAILGSTKPEIGATEYLSEVHGIEGGHVPSIDFEEEKALHNLVQLLITEQLLSSCESIFEGGIARALTDACMFGEIGASVTVPDMRPDYYLFSQAGSRMLISFTPSDLNKIKAMAMSADIPLFIIGKTGGENLIIYKGNLECSIMNDADKKFRIECGEMLAEADYESIISIPVSHIPQIYQEANVWMEETD